MPQWNRDLTTANSPTGLAAACTASGPHYRWRQWQFGSNTPLGRPAQPAELAPAYVFLASEETSSYVVGEVLGVTGGSKILP
jgi:NAD(P)-dependent dehydrogenase (short-subunit alcohol dehydrogenase family)